MSDARQDMTARAHECRCADGVSEPYSVDAYCGVIHLCRICGGRVRLEGEPRPPTSREMLLHVSHLSDAADLVRKIMESGYGRSAAAGWACRIIEIIEDAIRALRGYLPPDVFDYALDGSGAVPDWDERFDRFTVIVPAALASRIRTAGEACGESPEDWIFRTIRDSLPGDDETARPVRSRTRPRSKKRH